MGAPADPLASPTSPLGGPATRQHDPQPGDLLGPYRLVEVIGHGGMGVVYRAEQAEPIRRTVAVKLVRLGMDTDRVLRRFEAERQTLARMNHPGVAGVLDAGVSPEGRSYFVMEHVPGVPITEFCDAEDLDYRQRLELFVRVCHAAQHAHQKGVIHRDLKPSNILAFTQDGAAVPKIIDFGVAKAMDERLSGETALTRVGAIVGTPEYMSPEQAESGLDVDTTSDIYSLGVILYELLTGAPVLDPERLRAASASDVPRLVRENEPLRPSQRLSTLGDSGPQVARHRRSDLAGLRRALEGDLDWIVLKAIEKDRSRRYASTSELAADIERYLRQEPVTARPPGAAYRLRKFVARHRVGVAAGVLVAVSLVAGSVAATLGLLRARRAEAEAHKARLAAEASAEEARAVNRFFTEDVLSAADPRRKGKDVKVVDALAGALQGVGAARLRPEIEGAVRDAVGSTYHILGELTIALEQAEKAVALRRQGLGPEHPETLRAMSHHFSYLQEAGRLDEAERLGRETLALQRRVLGAENIDTLSTLTDLASVLYFAGKGEEAEAMARESVAARAKVLGPEHQRTLFAKSNLANLLSGRDKVAEAAALAAEVLAAQRRTLGPEHSNTLYTQKNLAGLLQDQGKPQEAEPLYRAALEAGRRISGENSLDTLVTRNDYALLLLDLGRTAEAEVLMRQVIAGSEATLPPGNRFTPGFHRNLGRVLTAGGKFEEAGRSLLYAKALFERSEGDQTRNRESVERRLKELAEARAKARR